MERSNIEGTACVYIMASRPNGTLYIGMTTSLLHRAYQHRQGIGGKFAKKHNVNRLVYYEFHEDAQAAIDREKRMKDWTRKKKLTLINRFNPSWKNLFFQLAK